MYLQSVNGLYLCFKVRGILYLVLYTTVKTKYCDYFLTHKIFIDIKKYFLLIKIYIFFSKNDCIKVLIIKVIICAKCAIDWKYKDLISNNGTTILSDIYIYIHITITDLRIN